ncbi:hypothetical protein [Candidatus Uabimicrobium sp. HlEnr_7]|uniref:hypothetical protein n=1 Tax=Candidatus Uabimicrobium helgolandensis TaxID=3095367 RepID=UPI003556601A
MDWEEVREECIRTGEFITISKKDVQEFPSFFEETNMGLSKGELKQFRDNRPTQSLHIHEFPDYYVAHVDLFNPKFHPVAHGILDTPGIALTLVGGAISVYFLTKAIKKYDLVPMKYEHRDQL